MGKQIKTKPQKAQKKNANSDGLPVLARMSTKITLLVSAIVFVTVLVLVIVAE